MNGRCMVWAATMGIWMLCGGTVVRAEAPRASGANTGDGSTPFTGLAQAPEASLFVGAATTSIPIAVPPGRQSLTPQLALVYTSSGGPSPYGYGWDLPVGKIQRSSKHGVLSCSDATYRNDFVLALPGANVECTLDPDTDRCLATVEESFIRIQYLRDDNHFEVWDKSGLHYIFGQTAAEREGGDVSVAFRPKECVYTYAWALSAVEDPNGNTLQVAYAPKDSGGLLYPRQIQYGGNRFTALPHRFAVRFDWRARATDGDQIVNGMEGFAATLTQLLAVITVSYLAPDGSPQVVRAYKLRYDLDDAAASQPPRHGRRSFLTAVTVFDQNGQALSNQSGLPASTTFLYQAYGDSGGAANPTGLGFELARAAEAAAKPDGLKGSQFGRWTQTAGGHSNTRRDIFDLNGDGIADLIDTQRCSDAYPRWDVYPGARDGFGPARSWTVPPGYCSIRWGSYDDDGGSRTAVDTLDLNGDGVPDLVDASQTPWRVFYGYVNADGGGGFVTAPYAWSAPTSFTRLTQGQTDLQVGTGAEARTWRKGWDDRQDLIDFNGDGLLDLAQTTPPNAQGTHGPMIVWFNTGSGFAESATVFAASALLRYTANDGTQIVGIYDVNGDGLPDQIVAAATNVWSVGLNTGHGLDRWETWNVPAGCDAGGLRRLANVGGNDHDVTFDFFDINGDGLPDLVNSIGYDPSSFANWEVCLNRGDGFAPGRLWQAPAAPIRNFGPGGGQANQAADKTLVDVFDIDGDGMVDFVSFWDPNTIAIFHSANGAWCASADGAACGAGNRVAVNPNGMRPDLLRQTESGTGGSTFLDYRPSTQWNNTDNSGVPRLPFVLWTVTAIERDDGLCNNDGSLCPDASLSGHTLHTTFNYGGGLYEPAAREFRGFGSVEQYDGDGNLTESFFLQDAVRKGKTYITETLAAGASEPVVYTLNMWNCVDLPDGRDSDCPHALGSGERRWVRLGETHRFDLPLTNAFAADTFTTNSAWDTYGNLMESTKGGTGTESVTTHTDYAANDRAYIVGKPMRVQVLGGDGRLLEAKWFTYDNGTLGTVAAGNVTAVYSWLDQVAPGGAAATVSCPQESVKCVATQMGYDAYGNITTVTDANLHSSTTVYDDDTHIYPSTVTNAAKQRVATGYDPKCGKPLWQTITYRVANLTDVLPAASAQEQTTYEYDTFCRPKRVTLPDETAPHLEYLYFLGAPRFATDVRWRRVEPAAPVGAIYHDEFYDALGRHVQTQRDAVVEGVATTVVESTLSFDSRGDPVRAYAPFAIPQQHSIAAKAYVPPPGSAGFTATRYDALHRPTEVTNPDGTTRRTHAYTVTRDVAGAWRWQSTARDECYNSGGTCPGSKVVGWYDALGRNVEQDLYDGDTFVARTGHTYDGLGRLIQTRQGTTPTSWNDHTAVTSTYDSLGRTIEVIDPDSGTPSAPGHWAYGYDLVGNLLRQDDPADNQYVAFTYDTINRPARKIVVTLTYPSPTPTPTGLFGGLAGACQKTTPTPIIQFISTTYTYDTYPTPPPDQTPGAGDPFGHYSLGRLTRVDDPSGSTRFEAYDVRGRVRQMTKVIDDTVNGTVARTATFKTDYDVADHVTQITYPDLESVVYGYDAAGQVTSLQNTAAPPTRYLTNATYDLFGRPRLISHGNGTTDTRTYGDRLQDFRLASIVTKQGKTTHLNLSYAGYTATGLLSRLVDGAGATLTNTATLTYNGLGQLTGVSGPNFPRATYAPPAGATSCASVTHGYCYDALGNMSMKEGMALTYSATQPHTLTALNGASVPAPDLNGNRMGKPARLNVPAQQYAYDAENRLQTIAAGDVSVDVRYDYAGRQVLKAAGSRTLRYFSDLAEEESSGGNGYLTKYYFAAGMRLAAQRVTGTRYAALASDGTVQLARTSLRRPTLLVWLRPDIVPGVGMVLVGLGLWLWLAPSRRRRRVGAVAVRHGQVIGVAIAFAVGTLPWPLLVAPRPAAAATSGSIYHYHTDHLGSTELITNGSGGVVQQIRYKPYGEIRYVSGTSFNARAFTGYEHDETSTLDFAGARWYDAAVGMFLTHDPARQFASPYTYTNWDPVNRTDPNGAIVPLIVIGIALAIAGVVAAGIDAGVRSGEPAVGLKAAGLAAASTVAGPLNGGLQLVAPKEFGHFHARDWAIAQIPVAGSAYGAARNFETGNYASGTVGVARSVYEAYGVYDNGSWSTPGEAATSVAKAATAPFIGDNFGEAWRNAVADTLAGNWTRGPTGGYMPASWAAALATVQYPDGAKANGMHAWHAGSNALFARSLGILGAPLLLAGGVLHESPLDWASFQAEQYWQGSVNHFLDSATDIAANVFGMGVGSSKLSGTSAALSTLAAEWGNYIPGPGEPDPAFGGGGPYKGNPTDAWGQYP